MDGAGKVDGSVVLALPIDQWSAPAMQNQFEGGGLTFWDGKVRDGASGTCRPDEIHYDTRSGDLAFIDRYVWNAAARILWSSRLYIQCRAFLSYALAFPMIFLSAVWHQADPITKGTRWALVIFYKVV